MWVGGRSILVQMGDIIDRGRNELDAILFLERLRSQAQRAGGAVHTLLGNHDALAVMGIFDYAPNSTGFLPNRFAFGETLNLTAPRVLRFPPAHRHRAAAFMPGGPAARMFASTRVAALRVNDTIFVHAVFDENHAKVGISSLNEAVRSWLLGMRPSLPSTVWRLLQDRDYGGREAKDRAKDKAVTCDIVKRALKAAGASRIVVGHTPQWAGLGGACGGTLWRADGALSVMSSLHRPMQVMISHISFFCLLCWSFMVVPDANFRFWRLLARVCTCWSVWLRTLIILALVELPTRKLTDPLSFFAFCFLPCFVNFVACFILLLYLFLPHCILLIMILVAEMK
jgi:hypothetical protein